MKNGKIYLPFLNVWDAQGVRANPIPPIGGTEKGRHQD